MDLEETILTAEDGRRLMEIANAIGVERLRMAGCRCGIDSDSPNVIRGVLKDVTPGDDLFSYTCPTCKVTAYHTTREVCEIHVSEMFNVPVESIPRKHPEQ